MGDYLDVGGKNALGEMIRNACGIASKPVAVILRVYWCLCGEQVGRRFISVAGARFLSLSLVVRVNPLLDTSFW